MSDQDQSAPIMVNATPTHDQLTAGVRQTCLGLSAVATAFGAAHLSQGLNTAALAATAIATAISGAVTVWVFVLGQIHTRRASKTLAVVAAAAPDSVAQVKP